MRGILIKMLQNEIQKAVKILKSGGLVAFPTETVYGLGADAKNDDAIHKIFQTKKRPIDHPLIVHLADVSQISEWAVEISPLALRLAEAFWPGPLTLILKKAPFVSDRVTGGQTTIGLRVPAHPVATALLNNFGSGLAAPSANRFGRISPTTAEAVREELGCGVELVLDGGQCEVGVESTIVAVSDAHPLILRPGMISVKQIEAVLQQSIGGKKTNVPRVSGSFASHYAPLTKTRIIATTNLTQFLQDLTEPCVVLLRSQLTIQKKILKRCLCRLTLKYSHMIYIKPCACSIKKLSTDNHRGSSRGCRMECNSR